MATASESAAGPVANIKVMSPAPQLTTPLNFALPLDSTVLQLKEKITNSLSSKPDPSEQRLIYRGKFLSDEQNIGGILGASANGEDSDSSDSYTFHLALRPSASAPLDAPPPTTTSTPAPTSSHTHATLIDRERLNAIERQRQTIQEAIGNVRQRLDRINDLTSLASSASRASSTPAVVTRVETRVDYAPGEGSGSSRVTRTTHMRASVRLTSRAAGRSGAGISQSLPTSPVRGVAGPASPVPPVLSSISTFNTPTGNDLNTIIANLQSGTQSAPPLYLLQGPDGQCLLVAGPPGSNSTSSTIGSHTSSENHPVIQRVGIDGYLPGESPTDTFASSDSSIPGLEGVTPESLAHLLDPVGYGVSSGRHGAGNMHRRGEGNAGLVRDMLMRERGRLQALREGLQRHQQQQHGNAVPGLNHIHQQHQQIRQFNIGDILRRVQDGGTHIWLAIRLVVFVVLFSGGAGWRRRIMLGTLALVIFIWQTGILNNQFAAARALYRELFPPTIQHPPQQQQPQPQPQAQQQQPTTGDANVPLDPSSTAQLLVQRHNQRQQTRFREAYESIERVLGLFVASLVPGMGERQVREHEERERLRAGVAAPPPPPPGEEQPAGRGDEAGPGEGAGDGQAGQAQRGMEDAMGGLFMGAL